MKYLILIIFFLVSCQQKQDFDEAIKKEWHVLDQLTLKSTPFDYDENLKKAFTNGFVHGFIKSVYGFTGTKCNFSEDKEKRAFYFGFSQGQSFYSSILISQKTNEKKTKMEKRTIPVIHLSDFHSQLRLIAARASPKSATSN